MEIPGASRHEPHVFSRPLIWARFSLPYILSVTLPAFESMRTYLTFSSVLTLPPALAHNSCVLSALPYRVPVSLFCFLCRYFLPWLRWWPLKPSQDGIGRVPPRSEVVCVDVVCRRRLVCRRLRAGEHGALCLVAGQCSFTVMIGDSGVKSLCRASSVCTKSWSVIYFNRQNKESLSLSLTRLE